jgi:hypothetical protein
MEGDFRAEVDFPKLLLLKEMRPGSIDGERVLRGRCASNIQQHYGRHVGAALSIQRDSKKQSDSGETK